VGDHAEASAGHDLRASAWSIARLGELLRSRHRLAFWVGVLPAMGCAAVIAASRPLWFDEVFTWQIATRSNVRELIEALGPMDPNPPLHYLLVRGAHALFGTGQLATRLPALLSFLVTLIVLHRLVVPLAGPLFALVVVAALLLTPAFDFAAEARPYAFLLACSATSLLAWREVTSGGRRRLGIAGLLVSLTAALYVHFYAFLLFVPIAAGEAVRTWTRRRLDLAVWVVLAVAGGLALPLLPLVQACLAVRTTFWAAPTLVRLGLSLPLFASLALVAVMATLLALIARYLSSGLEAAPEQPPPAAPAHVVAAAAGLASLPLIGFLVARLLTNAYDGRYVLPALLGVLLLFAHGSRLLRHRRTEVATILLAAVCLLAGVHLTLHARRALIEPLPTVPLPLPDHGPQFVVVADAFEFVQTVHAAPDTRDRLVYLIDGLSHPDYPRSSPDISVLGLSALLPLHVEDYDAFVAAHDRFWVFDETGRWGARLRAEGTNSGLALAAEPGGLQLWTR
jgi:Dolichyl-phosphate-mannose-protein mannosyltransferase